MTASSVAAAARDDMLATFGDKDIKPGHYLWDENADASGPARVVVSLGDQLAYLYRGDSLVAVAAISTGKPGKDTPTGIFSVLEKKPMHHSKKYDDAPMPFMQRIDQYGIALHAGHNPGHAASHGCIRIPMSEAKELSDLTPIGTVVLVY